MAKTAQLALFEPEQPAKPPERAPTLAAARVQYGDMWQLGRHRLLCGDSTKREDVAYLLGGAKADMLFTDPPYGVGYEGGHFHSGNVNIKRKRERLVADGDATIYGRFLPVVLPYVNGPCYVWFADSKVREVYNALASNRCKVHALIIWHKVNAKYAAINAQYKQRHEPCLYFKPRGATLRWCGPTNERTVWEMKRDPRNIYHPTQKPVALAERAIGNHHADLILDAFGGSGSTLLACENLGRACRIMELATTYCDVILRRWEQATGQQAVLIERVSAAA